MPEVNPADLFPTKMRLNLLLYDPLTQRYRHINRQSRHLTVENAAQWEHFLKAVDQAIAHIDANR
jgi:hypothetical protein